MVENHSRYHLHPSEGPERMILAVIFYRTNYDLWEAVLRTSHKFKNKWGFIEGTLKKPKPNNDENVIELQTWEMTNSMIRSWILNAIGLKLRSSIAYVDTVELMSSNLKKRYVMSSAPKIHQLKASLAYCKRGGMNLVEFYSNVMSLLSELEGRIRRYFCTCKKCECDIDGEVTQLLEEDKTY